jgi:E3 ubiquitin-protein ligase HACE1
MLGSRTDEYLSGLLQGFHSIIPSHMLKDFTPEEVELIVCGQPVVDVSDWKKNTMYTGGYTNESAVVIWFWEIIDEMLEV